MLSQETHKHQKLYQKDKIKFEFIGDNCLSLLVPLAFLS